MKILIVSSNGEAQPRTRAAAAAAFPGAQVEAFLDPLLAVKKNPSWNADMVICDFPLRIIDGIQLIQLLRRQDPDILPVLLTAEVQQRRDADHLVISHAAAADAEAFRHIWEQEQQDSGELYPLE